MKRLELLKEAIPGVSRVAVLWNPTQPAHGNLLKEIQSAASSLHVQVHPLEARGPKDFESAFSWMTRWRPGALLVVDDPVLVEHRRRIVDFALQQRLPTISGMRSFVHAGGLMAHGPSLADMSRRAATYVGKILQGAQPAGLPVEKSTRFELVINLKTAKSLRLDIPESVLARADEVIQ
jgi:putative ABC transport system substrate-binding protein